MAWLAVHKNQQAEPQAAGRMCDRMRLGMDDNIVHACMGLDCRCRPADPHANN